MDDLGVADFRHSQTLPKYTEYIPCQQKGISLHIQLVKDILTVHVTCWSVYSKACHGCSKRRINCNLKWRITSRRLPLWLERYKNLCLQFLEILTFNVTFCSSFAAFLSICQSAYL